MEELLKNHPLAAKVIIDYFKREFVKSIEESETIDEGFKEYAKTIEISIKQVVKMTANRPRYLFDVFDENNIFISVILTDDNEFHYSINLIGPKESYVDRFSAENAAVEVAFKMLEEKLSDDGIPETTTSGGGE